MSCSPHEQGTVATFDAATRSGSVVRDDGSVVELRTGAISAQLRLLRPGQRVRWLHDDSGRIEQLTLITLPL